LRFVAVVSVVFAAAVALAIATKNYLSTPPEDDQLAAGRTLYALHCASCHGADLEGQPNWRAPKEDGRLPAPPHDASGHTWHHSGAELFKMTKYGVSAVVPGYESDMPGFKGVLTDEEIQLVLDFIKSTWPPRESEYQRRRSQASPRS
jgi:mono/diheme cytochrome c family protein